KTVGFRRTEFRCDPLNERSRAIAPRLNDRLDRHLVNNTVAANGASHLCDTLVFSSGAGWVGEPFSTLAKVSLRPHISHPCRHQGSSGVQLR
ncbi:MAG: hypothetical protein ABW003_27705, partial [Microvirga sp.]